MVNLVKKFATIALAMTLAVGAVVPAAAATSPTTGTKAKAVTKSSVTYNKATYSTNKNGTAALKSEKSGKKSVTVNTVKYKKVTYKVTAINAKAFAKSKATTVTVGANVKTIKKNAFKSSKVKTIKFAGKKVVTVKKNAFKGSKVKTIKVTKKMSKKNFNKFKKALKKAGFKGKIKRY